MNPTSRFADFIEKKRRIILFLLIPLLSLLMHFHVFKSDLIGYHVWRQTQTQTTIENFYHEDFNILNPRINNRGNGTGIYRMEFPIMQWVFAGFYKIFGDHVIISRILSFITGLFSLWGIYFLLCSLFKRHQLALLGAWCFTFSPVFYYYMLNPLPDNFALCCCIYGMAFFFKWIDNRKFQYILLSAIFICLSVLAKLPFIVCTGGIGIFLLKDLKKGGLKNSLAAGFIYSCFLIIPLTWYLKVVGTWQGNGIVSGILSVSKSDIPIILDILQGNLISTLPELLINYGSVIFFVAGLWILFYRKKYKNTLFPILLFWGIGTLLYFFFEMNMIGTVHDYYMFPFLPLLFIIVAYGTEKLVFQSAKIIRIVAFIALSILPVTAFLRADHRWNTANPGFNKNLLAYKNELRNAVPDSSLCIVGNDESPSIFLYYVNKKGWVFDNDSLNCITLKAMINAGARYLYTDSKKVQGDSLIRKSIEKEIMQKGDIKVYKLKGKNY